MAGHAKCWLHHHLIVSRFKSFSQMTLVPGSLKGKHSWFLFLYLSHTFNSLSLFRLIALCSDDAELYLRQLPSGSVMELIISRGPKAALLSTILLTPCLHEAKRRGHSSTLPLASGMDFPESGGTGPFGTGHAFCSSVPSIPMASICIQYPDGDAGASERSSLKFQNECIARDAIVHSSGL